MPAKSLKIALVSSEMYPLAKTGGLADVIGALSKTLADMGHDIKVFLPNYKAVQLRGQQNVSAIEPALIPVGSKRQKIRVRTTHVSGNKAEVVLIDYPEYFDRGELYKDKNTGFDYADNDERFILFSRGVLEVIKALNFSCDVIHANEWQAALTCAYLKNSYKDDPFFAKTGTVFSIHNLAYQGVFPSQSFQKLGLPEELFHPYSPFEFHGKLNFLKAGIVFSDVVSTVSETYAVEIQSSAEYGYGLEGVLRERNDDLYGIVNGVDYRQWSPEDDSLIPARYDSNKLNLKEENKKSLYRECGFANDRLKWPAVGIISRLVDQKGLDLLSEITKELFSKDLTLVVLGTGDSKYESLLRELEQKHTGRVKAFVTFDEKLAHLIEAGCDIFLMPSKYEPCGLNQLYSLKYGTVPVARATGGLVDTIQDYNGGNGTGFLFKGYNSLEFLQAIERALEVYQDKKRWQKLQQNGMKQDFSWEKAAEKYVELYNLARKT
ncbi:MAG: glycogen synthase GlgA [candidate division Zixibacteria bacterium]|nr:glycogen synthase GlgA [candidate division Zixibacteria bacterium]